MDTQQQKNSAGKLIDKMIREEVVVERMARYDHYLFRCESCGQVHNLTKKARFSHFFSCKPHQRLMSSMKVGYLFLLAMVAKSKREKGKVAK